MEAVRSRPLLTKGNWGCNQMTNITLFSWVVVTLGVTVAMAGNLANLGGLVGLW